MIDEIYFVQAPNGAIKIGHSSDLPRRISSLQVGAGALLTLLVRIQGAARTERYIHHTLKDHRLIGEWFKPHRDVLDFVDRLKVEGDACIHPDFRYSPSLEITPVEPDEIIEECRDYILSIGTVNGGINLVKDIIARTSKCSGIGVREVRGIWNRESRALKASTYRTLRELFEMNEAQRLLPLGNGSVIRLADRTRL